MLYSGTVAAAIEGRFLGLPAIAVSLVMQPGSGQHFATAARVAAELVHARAALRRCIRRRSSTSTCRTCRTRRSRVTRRRGSASAIAPNASSRTEDPRGRPVYWVGPAGGGQDVGPGTDFHAVANNYVSVTPLQIDLTRHSMLDDMRAWLQGRERESADQNASRAIAPASA